jgi:hypothetical protein
MARSDGFCPICIGPSSGQRGHLVQRCPALMTGAQGVEALKKAANVAKGYKPAK